MFLFVKYLLWNWSQTTFLNLALTNMVDTISNATQALKNATKAQPTEGQKKEAENPSNFL